MKILSFVDLHGSQKALKEIAEKVKKDNPDIIICAGDFTVFEQNSDLIMSRLNSFRKPVLVVPGNHETEGSVNQASKLFKNIINLHKKRYDADGWIFLGYGGGGFSLIDKEFERLAERWEKSLRKEDNVVLVTHAPPYKTELDRIMDGHCGSKSLLRFIKKVDLTLVICGHIHENAGKEHRIGKTKIINPGPYGKIVKL